MSLKPLPSDEPRNQCTKRSRQGPLYPSQIGFDECVGQSAMNGQFFTVCWENGQSSWKYDSNTTSLWTSPWKSELLRMQRMRSHHLRSSHTSHLLFLVNHPVRRGWHLTRVQWKEGGNSEKHTDTLYGILCVKLAWNELIWHVCPGNQSTQYCWCRAQQRMCREGHPGKTNLRSIGRLCQALLLSRSSLGWQEGGKLKWEMLEASRLIAEQELLDC